MRIEDLIDRLTLLKKEYGGDPDVMFETGEQEISIDTIQYCERHIWSDTEFCTRSVGGQDFIYDVQPHQEFKHRNTHRMIILR